MIERFPFFVYGTLVPGQVNDFYWEGCVGEWKAGFFGGGRLYDMGSFPMLVEGGEEKVAGWVMYPYKGLADAEYQLLVQRLDRLENYDPDEVENSPYYRVLRTVFGADGEGVRAWVYLGRPIYTEGRPHIAEGDWVSYSASAQSFISEWWEEQGQGRLFGEDKNETDGKD